MSLDTIYRKGIERVWDEDSSSQANYINAVLTARNMKCMELNKLHAFFIPNDHYVERFFGSEILNPMYGFYDKIGTCCYWNNCLVFPIYNVADKIVSVVGFNPFRYVEAKEKKDWSLNYYIYADSQHFKKGAHLFYLEGAYSRALDEGYLFLTDGIFDTISLQTVNFISAALMGSSVTSEIAALLRFIKRLIVVIDNDEAGQKLANDLMRVHPQVTIVKQKLTKDIDDLLKGDRRDRAITELEKAKVSGASYFTLSV